MHASVRFVQHRADSDVEDRPLAVDDTDGATIGATRPGFERSDLAHGHQFGGAGDRAAGEQRLQHMHEGGIRTCGRLHRTGHLPQRGVGFSLQQLLDVYAAGGCDPSQIVAQQVDDHHVFGALLGAGLQLQSQGCVQFGCGAASSRTFHGTGSDPAIGAVPVEKKLRGK